MRVGFIGLGSQGGPMARRIVEGGYETTLWARRPATLEPFADTPAKVAEYLVVGAIFLNDINDVLDALP